LVIRATPGRQSQGLWLRPLVFARRYQAAFELARIGQEFTPALLPTGAQLPEKNFHRIWEDGQD